jgi:type II secretory pathway component PulC
VLFKKIVMENINKTHVIATIDSKKEHIEDASSVTDASLEQLNDFEMPVHISKESLFK